MNNNIHKFVGVIVMLLFTGLIYWSLAPSELQALDIELSSYIDRYESTKTIFEKAERELADKKLDWYQKAILLLKDNFNDKDYDIYVNEIERLSFKLFGIYTPTYRIPQDLFYVFLKEDGVYVTQGYQDHYKKNGLLAVDIGTNQKPLTQYAPDLYNREVEWTTNTTCNFPESAGTCLELIRDKDTKFLIGHIKNYLISNNITVKTGTPIAITGGDQSSEGRSTGLHAHIEFYTWDKNKEDWIKAEYKIGQSNQHIVWSERIKNPIAGWDIQKDSDDTHLAWDSDYYKDYDTPWQILSAIHLRESGRQKIQRQVSSAGARGQMQFMPATWQGYCPELNIDNLKDSITCADRYLQANLKAQGSWEKAIWRYNHSDYYVNFIIKAADTMGFNSNI